MDEPWRLSIHVENIQNCVVFKDKNALFFIIEVFLVVGLKGYLFVFFSGNL